MKDMDELVEVWGEYLKRVGDWHTLVEGVEPKETGCGPVYELPNPIDRPSESFAIADMSQLEISEPHKHINGETEIYFVLQGRGKIAVGEDFMDLETGVNVVTPPDVVHIVRPLDNLRLEVINPPSFNADNYVALSDTEAAIAKKIMELKATV